MGTTFIPRFIKHRLKQFLQAAGYEVFNKRSGYAQDGLLTVHSDHFRSDPQFRAAYARGIKASAGVDPRFEWRVHIALWAARAAAKLPGDFVECGVNAGFISSAIMQRLNWSSVGKQFYLIDTFEGPVFDQFSADETERGRADIARQALAAGAYVTDMDRVHDNFSEWRNVQIVKGRVPEILRAMPFGPVAFLHVDLNCAYPEREALQFFWNLLSPHGMVLLDDYAYIGYAAQTKAVNEFAVSAGTEVLSLPTGQGLIIK
ncbi:MAG TPA: TylF/MycF/NovP-related O-methyltransferase [Bryobacteraceae bacterium]|nr:TylF/MycF/NovP-related O-methyltransferase [Bryobacteraceae bacterium]